MQYRFALLSAVLLMQTIPACGKDGPTATGARLSRSRLNGEYSCVQFEGYFVGPQGPGLYEGTCEAYLSSTNPSRRDSIEVAAFSINEDNSVSRQDFPAATASFDSTTARLVISGTEIATEHYDAFLQSGIVYLVRTFEPFDFSGDGIDDELVLIYRRR